MHQHAAAQTTHFPTAAEGLPAARATEIVEVPPGGRYDLHMGPVAKQVGDNTLRMLAYNGSVPGPTLRVEQNSEITVVATNESDLEQTVHWHGLRLDNRYDGTHETQRPIGAGESFEYRLAFPDAGVYWYHPHIREDYAQEMGLYGNIVVVPEDPDYWAPVHRELTITLDDVLVEDGRITPFGRDETNFAAMGRFGETMLIAGGTQLDLSAQLGEVVRLYLTNTANTRVFNFRVNGARMKLVGGDSGRCEHEELVGSVVLAPSERAVVDVLYDAAGHAKLEHLTPGRTYQLGTVAVSDAPAAPGPGLAFDELRVDPELNQERERMADVVAADPDKELGLVAEMEFEEPEGPVVYVCPMHPDVVSEQQGSCPHCGMKLMPASAEHAHAHDHDHQHATADGIEWEDDMVEVNRATTPANTRWKIVDRQTGAANKAIAWRFRVGDRVKVRVVNEMESDHPIHHPFHVHGAGRFLVVARDGVPERNLAWKDTVLIRTGEVVDILLDITNPGRWMAHCHIAEHHESGMMFSFEVIS